ncbi:MAG: ATP-dependent Clp protease ATP-binding subunit [Verrucomicrobiota bacterium]|nr:ATP-dependent Clp protease ATP-binding subunit [Verrucomicrobiota bacterium]
MVSTLTAGEAACREHLRGLRLRLEAAIRGQAHVMERVASVLIRGELGLAHPGRPKGSFLFVGPTGVGKTELTNVFTACLFAGRKPIRFDMSEYQNQSSVEKLIGQSGSETGLLGRALEGVADGTLLFDEIEKAHPLVLDLFLQMLDDASITLATGERKNLSRFYVVFTSNIGSSEVMRMTSAPMATVERTVLSRVGQQLRPELVGRVTEKLVFARLGFDTQREICELMIEREQARLRGLGFALETNGGVIEFLIRRGFHKTLGARPMRSVVERHLQDAIAEGLLSHGSGSGRVEVDSRNEHLVLRRHEQ